MDPELYYLGGAAATLWIMRQASTVAVGAYRAIQHKRNGKPVMCGCPYADQHSEILRENQGALGLMCESMKGHTEINKEQTRILHAIKEQNAVVITMLRRQ